MALSIGGGHSQVDDHAAGGREPGQTGSPVGGREVDPVLRAKYLDYCSALLSEIFLSLSDERIYRLVEEAARERGVDPASLGFDAMVELATEKLRREVPLPELQEWAREYRAHPDRYDPMLLGFWEGDEDE